MFKHIESVVGSNYRDVFISEIDCLDVDKSPDPRRMRMDHIRIHMENLMERRLNYEFTDREKQVISLAKKAVIYQCTYGSPAKDRMSDRDMYDALVLVFQMAAELLYDNEQ